jgi:hypothetical protein
MARALVGATECTLEDAEAVAQAKVRFEDIEARRLAAMRRLTSMDNAYVRPRDGFFWDRALRYEERARRQVRRAVKKLMGDRRN